MKYTFQNKSVVLDLEHGQIEKILLGITEITKGSIPIFSLRFRSPHGEGEILSSFDCTFVSFDGKQANYTHPKADISLLILQEENGLAFSISVQNHTQNLVEWVEVMSFGVEKELRDEGGIGGIVYPFNEGCLVTDMKKRENSPFRYLEPDYPSLSKYSIFPNMVFAPFLGYITNAGGVYLGMHDKTHATKHIDFRYEADAVKLQMRCYTGANYGEDYTSPFPFVMQFVAGNYFAVLDVYRDWFDKTKPQTLTKICETPSLPKWYGESPIVAIYPIRGSHDTGDMSPNGMFPYENAFPYLDEIAHETEARVMALIMHWEGTAPWAPPFMWPPYGGESLFSDFVRHAHEKNILVGLYASGLGYTLQSNTDPAYNKRKSFEEDNIRALVCANSNEEISGAICTAQRVGYDLCPAVPAAGKMFADEISKVTAGGIDYLQAFDQNHGGGSYFCYSSNHGHPPVPGAWQTAAVKNILAAIDTHGVMLGCESGAAEPFIEELRFSDNRFNLNYYIGLPIPMYAYIYHEYVNNFMGNQICMMLSHEPYNYSYRLAYSFIAGDIPSVVLDDKGNIAYAWGKACFKEHTDKTVALTFLKNLTAWRRLEGKNYLHFGRMIPTEIAISCEKNSFVLEDSSTLYVDKLLTSAFMFEGKKAQFVVNYNTQTEILDLPAPATVCFDPAGQSKETLSHIAIPPLSAIMIEL